MTQPKKGDRVKVTYKAEYDREWTRGYVVKAGTLNVDVPHDATIEVLEEPYEEAGPR